MKTFQMAVQSGKVTRDVLDSFEFAGETFAVHVKGDGYAVSHVGSGYGVPGSYAETINESRNLAESEFAKLGEASVLGAIKEVMK